MRDDKEIQIKVDRKYLTKRQVYVLTSYFKIDHRPCVELIEQIAKDADLTAVQVRKWFTDIKRKLKEDKNGEFEASFENEWNKLCAAYMSSPTMSNDGSSLNMIETNNIPLINNLNERTPTTNTNLPNNTTFKPKKTNPLSIEFLLKDDEP